MAESLRAFSYDLSSALADLVDNSITAGAQNIWIDFHWAGAHSVITVTDDGHGMDEPLLRGAMRLGSQHPLAPRSPNDLGRFGLGLKTASFSQCRRLTVRSHRVGHPPATRCWDLDHLRRVNRWELLHEANDDAQPHLHRLEDLGHGTAVIWQVLDHLCGGQQTDNERQHQHFLQRARAAADSLGIVFHRFMGRRSGVRIRMNGSDTPIEPWDPFLEDEPATQRLPITRLKCVGETVEVAPFVLPHVSKLAPSTFRAAGGVRGWTAHQGFYIYRGRRLLVAGDWLGLGWTKDEHYKLARIRIDLPNALDLDWELDVTKSRALPPPSLRHDLRSIAEVTRQRAKEVYSHRGARLTREHDDSPILLWEPMAKHGKTFYKLSREHPLVKAISASVPDRRQFGALLRLIEETVPLPHITIQNAEHPESLAGPFEGTTPTQVLLVMREVIASLIASGLSRRDAVASVSTVHPFGQFPELIQLLHDEDSRA